MPAEASKFTTSYIHVRPTDAAPTDPRLRRRLNVATVVVAGGIKSGTRPVYMDYFSLLITF